MSSVLCLCLVRVCHLFCKWFRNVCSRSRRHQRHRLRCHCWFVLSHNALLSIIHFIFWWIHCGGSQLSPMTTSSSSFTSAMGLLSCIYVYVVHIDVSYAVLPYNTSVGLFFVCHLFRLFVFALEEPFYYHNGTNIIVRPPHWAIRRSQWAKDIVFE